MSWVFVVFAPVGFCPCGLLSEWALVHINFFLCEPLSLWAFVCLDWVDFCLCGVLIVCAFIYVGFCTCENSMCGRNVCVIFLHRGIHLWGLCTCRHLFVWAFVTFVMWTNTWYWSKNLFLWTHIIVYRCIESYVLCNKPLLFATEI